MPEFTPTPPPEDTEEPTKLIQVRFPSPALRTTKTRVYQLRLTPEQWEQLTRKATFDRRTVADFIRTRCGI